MLFIVELFASDGLRFRNEGYNSRINRILAVQHPNANVLLTLLVSEMVHAELEIERTMATGMQRS